MTDTSMAPATAGPSPPDEALPTQPGGGDHRRRLALIAAIVAVVVVAAIVIVVAGRGDNDETSSSSASPSTTLTPTTAASTTASTEAGATATNPPSATTTATTQPAPVAVPQDPNAYAVATFTAWSQGDLTALAELAEPKVVGFLAAASPGGGSWEGPQFEGAAGSTYATWTRPEIEFVVRVRNEMAQAGEPHAVIEAFFSSAPGRVAIWPFTTQDEANATQEQVGQGHQPWLLDPAMVASSYAESELGWDNATVVMVQAGGYEVTDPDSGARANLVLSQPARTGEGGIWAVTRAGG